MQTGITQVIKGMLPDAVTVLAGVVKSVSPLSIEAIGDEKLVIPESLLIVPQHLTRHAVLMDIPKMCSYSGEGVCNYNGKDTVVTVHSELKVGETLYLLSYNNGKKYYVLDRSE